MLKVYRYLEKKTHTSLVLSVPIMGEVSKGKKTSGKPCHTSPGPQILDIQTYPAWLVEMDGFLLRFLAFGTSSHGKVKCEWLGYTPLKQTNGPWKMVDDKHPLFFSEGRKAFLFSVAMLVSGRVSKPVPLGFEPKPCDEAYETLSLKTMLRNY